MWKVVKKTKEKQIHQTFSDGFSKTFMGVKFVNHRPMLKLLA